MDVTTVLLAVNLLATVLLSAWAAVDRLKAAKSRKQFARLEQEKDMEFLDLGGRVRCLCLLVLWDRLKDLPQEKRHAVIDAALKPRIYLPAAAAKLGVSEDDVRELVYKDRRAWIYPEL